MNTVVELRAGLFLACTLWAAMPVANQLGAQSGSRSGTERVSLVVRPHVGDTLWLRVEQTMETRSVPLTNRGDAAMRGAPLVLARLLCGTGIRPVRDPSISQTTWMRLNAHSLVESSDLKATWLSATTDSVLCHRKWRTAGAGTFGEVIGWRSQHSRERHADGAMTIVDAGANTAALQRAFPNATHVTGSCGSG